MVDRYRKNRRAKKLREEMYGMVQRKFISLEEAERLYPRATEDTTQAMKDFIVHGEAIVKIPKDAKINKESISNAVGAILEMKQNRDSLNKDIEKYLKMAEEKLK